jgi:transposase
VQARVDGTEIDQLAERFGIGRNTVMAHLARQGVPGRRWPGRTLTPGRIEEAGQLYKTGLRLELVAEQFGVDRRYLRRALAEVGFVIRRPGRQQAR